ncbi:MAG: SsrA-binding protein SmpB, partial [Candidatus Avigastranaerophilus sp.]
MAKKIISANRKAFHEYHIFDKYTAGMVLTGTEIKSVRKGAVNLKDSFVRIDDFEPFLYNCHISLYEQGNRYNHEEKRTRKLLLNKKEIEKMLGKIKKDGY